MTVLAWGRIGGAPGGGALPARRFAAQLDWIQDAALAVLPLEAAAQRPRAGVALTLDGGSRDTYTTALPLLAARGLPATTYVATATVGGREAMPGGVRPLTWAMLRELQAAGWEIGSHGLGRGAPGTLAEEALRAALRDSRAALEEALGVRCRHFALPAGTLDRRLLEAVRAAGYETAAVTSPPPGGLAAAPGVVLRTPVSARTPWWLFRLKARGWEGRLRAPKAWILGVLGSAAAD